MEPYRDASGSTPLPPPSQIPHRTWSVLRVSCLAIAIGATALLLGACVTVGVIAWRIGWWDEPPELPAFIYPANATKTRERELRHCYPPVGRDTHCRVLDFEGAPPFETTQSRLLADLANRGWTEHHGGAASRAGEAFVLSGSSPDREHCIAYRAAANYNEANMLLIEIQIIVYECPRG